MSKSQKLNVFALVDDLGTDRTMIYRVHPESATAEPSGLSFAQANAGAGPRHLVIDSGNHFVYVLNEIQSSVTRFAFDAAHATLRKLDTVSTLPSAFKGPNTGAEIAFDSQGRTLYTSNRGHDSIAVLHVKPDGTLQSIQNIASEGRTPRSFALDLSGKWLLTANQDTDNIGVFAVTPRTRRLTSTGSKLTGISQPVCVLFWRP